MAAAPPAERAHGWSRRRIIGSALAAAAVLVAALAPLASYRHFALFPQDEGLLVAYPSLILHGLAPNRSFESVYGATNLWVLAGAFKVGGVSIGVERTVGALYRLVIVGSLVTLGLRRRGPMAGLCAGLVSVVILAGTIGLAAFAWLAGLAFGALGLALADIGLAGAARRRVVGLAGLCFGLMAGCRLDLVVAGGLAVGILAWLRPEARRPLGIGVAAGLVPLAINVIQAGPIAVLHQQLLAPVFVTGPARRLPLSTLGWQGIILLVLCGAVAVGLTAAGWRAVRADRAGWEGVLLVAVGCFDLGLLPQALQRCDGVHLALVACWVMPSAVLLPPLRLFGRAGRERGVPRGNLVPVVLAVVALALVADSFGRIWRSALPVVGTPVVEYRVTHDGRSVPMPSAAAAQQLDTLLAAVGAHSRAGQRLFVGPRDLTTAGYADTYLYYLLPELPPATRYLEMDPGVANGKGSTLAAELARADVVILNSAYDTFPVSDPSSRHGATAPNQVMTHQFRPVASSGTWTLYVRRQG